MKNRRLSISLNIYLAFLYRLAIVFFLYALCRLIFYLINSSLFPGISLSEWITIYKGGFRFDLTAILYTNVLFILIMIIPFRFRYNKKYEAFVKWVFIITNSIALLLNAIDFIYYRFTLRRTTWSVIKEFSNEQNFGKLGTSFLADFWYVAIIYIFLIWLLIWLYKKVVIKPFVIKPLWKYYAICTVLMALILTLFVGGVRGDFRHSTRPITLSNAGEYVKRPNEMYLVLNTPFCIIRTLRLKAYEKKTFFEEKELEKIYSPVHQYNSTDSFKYDNVVIIILESWEKEAVGGYNSFLDGGKYTGYTPFLDSLMKLSKVSYNAFANGRKSIDALPAILAGIPAGPEPFVLTPFASNKIKSLPSILREKGYHTSFFHGAPNGSMGFKAFTNLVGVEHYYGKDEYNNDKDYDGIWGIWDEPFFQFFANKLNAIPQPFFSAIFSVSSHHPFKVPEKYKGAFKKGPLPVLECIGYTDMALRNFFETAGKMSWFKKTLFVITADHGTVTYHPEYKTAWGAVAIPILFYHPGDSSLRKTDYRLVQQVDIMPSVLSYLNYKGKFLSFGKNVFSDSSKNFAVNYGSYNWFQDEYLLESDGLKTMGLYNYTKDLLLKKDLQTEQRTKAEEMSKMYKAFIQQYNNRLIEDRLLPE